MRERHGVSMEIAYGVIARVSMFCAANPQLWIDVHDWWI
jgi:hypothetical protein